jgi:hypothetical protein
MSATHKKQQAGASGLPAISQAQKGRLAKHASVLVPAVFCAVTIAFYWPILFCKGFLWNDFLDQNFVYRLFSAVSLKQGIIPRSEERRVGKRVSMFV